MKNLLKNNILLLVVLSILFFLPPQLPSLGAINPSDLYSSLYTQIDRWYSAGLIEKLPLVRPYPLQIFKDILSEVMEHENSLDSDRETAQRLIDELFQSSKLQLFAMHETRIGLKESGTGFSGLSGIGGSLNWEIDPLVTTSFVLNPYFVDYTDGTGLPSHTRESHDWIPDNADIDLFGRNLKVQTSLLSMITVGTTDLYASLGFSRLSLRDFPTLNVVLSQEASYRPNFIFHWRGAGLEFDFLYSSLSASDNTGSGYNTGKNMVYHSIGGDIFDWLSISFFETVIWGNHFNLAYFVPFSSLFLSQGFTGFHDNSLLGFSLEFRPTSNLRIPLYVYADDVHFNDIIRLNLDTKYKLAAQIGTMWNPNDPIYKGLSFVLTAIMPYMYTHWDETAQTYADDSFTSDINYSNYTHFGSNIGPSFDPNSLNITLTNSLTFENFLDTLFSLSYTIHGNASSGFTSGDGDIFDPGYDGTTPTFQSPYDQKGQPYTRFLTQSILEHTVQFGIDLSASFFIDSLLLEPRLNYTFEFTANKDFQSGTSEINNYISLSIGLIY